MLSLPDVDSPQLRNASSAELLKLQQQVETSYNETMLEFSKKDAEWSADYGRRLRQAKETEEVGITSEPQSAEGGQEGMDRDQEHNISPEPTAEEGPEGTAGGPTDDEYRMNTIPRLKATNAKLRSLLAATAPAESIPGSSTQQQATSEACVACKEHGQECVPQKYVIDSVSSPTLYDRLFSSSSKAKACSGCANRGIKCSLVVKVKGVEVKRATRKKRNIEGPIAKVTEDVVEEVSAPKKPKVVADPEHHLTIDDFGFGLVVAELRETRLTMAQGLSAMDKEMKKMRKRLVKELERRKKAREGQH